MKYHLSIFIISLAIASPKSYAQEQNNDPISKAIDKHGKAFLNNKNITSVSIGVFKDGQTYTYHGGEIEKGQGNTPTNETIYEVGSVTKTMTGYLVARAVLEEKIKLDDDVRIYIKGEYPKLEYEGHPITIKHLLTHTSGLPMSLPIELNAVFEKLDEHVPDRYYEIEQTYNKEKFLADLKNVTITIQPGTKYSYSNAGAELIGYVLETVYKKSIDELLKESFLQKYGMLNTGIEINDTQKQKLIRGYWMSNTKPSPNQLNKLWATGSGAKMNLTDMLRFMKLQLDNENPIVEESHKILLEEGKTLKVAYFWRVWTDKYGRSYNHHGGTSGVQNWLFIFPKYKLGISVITNQSGPKTPELLNDVVRKMLKDIIRE
jgi:serine-type D-Ala-D-Ala carboxypeptidase/endopeptidase